MRSGFVSVGREIKYGGTSISFYLYHVSWANGNVVVVLPRIMVVDDGRLIEMR
jgi:hypothetical protein